MNDTPITYPNNGKCPAAGCKGRLTHGLYHHYFCTVCRRHFKVDLSAKCNPDYALIRETTRLESYEVRLDNDARDKRYSNREGRRRTTAELNAQNCRNILHRYTSVFSDSEFRQLINALHDVEALQTLVNEFVNEDDNNGN